jgi:hypothetical protein
MLKKVLVGTGIAAALGAVSLLGSLAAGPVLAARYSPPLSSPTVAYADPAGETEGVEGVEPASEQAQEANLPGGGHQDPQGANTDHQFDGIE